MLLYDYIVGVYMPVNMNVLACAGIWVYNAFVYIL